MQHDGVPLRGRSRDPGGREPEERAALFTHDGGLYTHGRSQPPSRGYPLGQPRDTRGGPSAGGAERRSADSRWFDHQRGGGQGRSSHLPAPAQPGRSGVPGVPGPPASGGAIPPAAPRPRPSPRPRPRREPPPEPVTHHDAGGWGYDGEQDEGYGQYGRYGRYGHEQYSPALGGPLGLDDLDGPDGPGDPDWPGDGLPPGRGGGSGGGPGGGRHRIPPPSRAGWKRYVIRGVAVLGVVILLAGGYVGYEYWRLNHNIKRVDVLQTDDGNIRDADKQKNAENFLLIGSDTREGANSKYGDSGGARSDTTILAHLSPNHDKAILISFPRDSWVTIPECTGGDGETVPEQQNQFNVAFQIGGPACTIRTVQKLTGIAVTHYLQVDFTGFKSMVDALGGVEICSTEKVFDKDSGLRLHEGNNMLRGEQALAYVRARHNVGDGSDISRIQRQQRFLGALMRKATSGGVLTNPLKLRDFLDAATKSLTMDKDTGLGDLKNLAEGLNGLDPSKVSFVTPPIADRAYDPRGIKPKGYGDRVLLDDAAGRVLYDSIINDKQAPPTSGPTSAAPPKPPPPPTITVAPDDVTVQVWNGVGQPGLAGRARDDLTSVGFTVAGVGNKVSGAQQSVVRYAPGQIEAARTLGSAVPGSVLQEDASLSGETVELVVGSSYAGAHAVSVGAPATTGGGTGTGGGQASPAMPQNGPITPSDAVNAGDSSCV